MGQYSVSYLVDCSPLISFSSLFLSLPSSPIHNQSHILQPPLKPFYHLLQTLLLVLLGGRCVMRSISTSFYPEHQSFVFWTVSNRRCLRDVCAEDLPFRTQALSLRYLISSGYSGISLGKWGDGSRRLHIKNEVVLFHSRNRGREVPTIPLSDRARCNSL